MIAASDLRCNRLLLRSKRNPWWRLLAEDRRILQADKRLNKEADPAALKQRGTP